MWCRMREMIVCLFVLWDLSYNYVDRWEMKEGELYLVAPYISRAQKFVCLSSKQ